MAHVVSETTVADRQVDCRIFAIGESCSSHGRRHHKKIGISSVKFEDIVRSSTIRKKSIRLVPLIM